MAKINEKAQAIIKRIEKATLNPVLDKEAVVRAFKKQYKLLGVDFPKKVIWRKDLVLGFEASAGAARDAAWGAAWGAARGAARDAAWDTAWDTAWGAAWGAARGAARDAARDAAWGAARDAAWDTARGAAWDTAWDAAWDAAAVNTGLKDAAIIKYVAIETQTLKALENGLAWYFPMQDRLILVPLPKFSFDEEQRLHSENKPAVYWKGGAKFYFYHGVKVSQKIIESPEKLTKKDWLNESNLETRRVIQERMPDFVKKIGGKKINKSDKGELYEIDLGSDPEKIAHYVKVKDSSTSREYFLRVPPTINEVNTALAWTFGFDKASDYGPTKET